ncbi:MAG: hypothetical protein KatS3mg035_1918 [Bacteroidia bacterium]|nr:MAG: hypothetical protein KatS3mg035_1918 [Bacteroidia bacterium]
MKLERLRYPCMVVFIHHKDGSTAYQPYGIKEQAIYSVSRGAINMKLIDLAEQQPNVKLHFNERCDFVDKNSGTIKFVNTETNNVTTLNPDLIFGADGAFSAVRLNMQLQNDRFDYHQFYIEASYKELSIPPGEKRKFFN